MNSHSLTIFFCDDFSPARPQIHAHPNRFGARDYGVILRT